MKYKKTINKNSKIKWQHYKQSEVKDPLLVVVIGLALFAFIAGDAWKVLQPHQGKQDVGEVNGKTLTAQEYQKNGR